MELSIDEKSQIQARDRTAPILPMRPGCRRRRPTTTSGTGTTTLFAALEVATGKVTDACYPRHRHEEFLRFLKQHPAVQAWLAKNPRITMQFTPTSGSWLTMVGIFSGIITRQASSRGTFTSVKDLIAAIEPSSTAGTNAASPLPGPRPPTKCSIRSRVAPQQGSGRSECPAVGNSDITRLQLRKVGT